LRIDQQPMDRTKATPEIDFFSDYQFHLNVHHNTDKHLIRLYWYMSHSFGEIYSRQSYFHFIATLNKLVPDKQCLNNSDNSDIPSDVVF